MGLDRRSGEQKTGQELHVAVFTLPKGIESGERAMASTQLILAVGSSPCGVRCTAFLGGQESRSDNIVTSSDRW